MDEDIIEGFRGLKQARQEERADRRGAAPERLRAAGVAFESKNEGAHLIVRDGKRIIDFWPGTGRWWERGKTRYTFGLDKLLADLRPAPGEANHEPA